MHEILLVLHLVLFCYWLGGDIGVFYASGMACDDRLSLEARMTAARIMLGLDVVPRFCGAVMLTVGIALSTYNDVTLPAWLYAALLLLAPAWFAHEWVLHYRLATPLGQRAARIDNPFKAGLMIACLAMTVWALGSERFAAAPWVGYKIGVFAWILLCSLAINRTIGPYVAGIQQMAAGHIDSAATAAMGRSLVQCKWAVVGIWAGLVVSAILGVVRPGAGV